MTEIDFIARLKFQTTEQGGRKGYANSGYRPHIEFENYPEYLTSGQQNYIGKDIVEPGEIINAEIRIIGTEYFRERLFEGMKFKFCEGKHIIGFGEIIGISNKKLEIINNDKTSNNLNLYPQDIINKIKTIYGGLGTAQKKTSEIQELINSEKHLRSPRIIRSMIYLFTIGKMEKSKVFEFAKIDWRDVLSSAEYDKNQVRLRNFNNEFGKEKIKASR